MELRGARVKQLRNKRAIDTGHNRTLVAGAIFAVLFVVLAGRVVDLSLLSGHQEPKLVHSPESENVDAVRANIVDRNGVLIATSLPTDSLIVDSKAFLNAGEDPTEAAIKLARILPELSIGKTVKKLNSGKRFDYLVRTLTPNQKHQVNQLGIPGLDYQREERRTYPHGPTMAHVLGFTDVDGRGISGIEKSFNHQLTSPGGTLDLAIDVRVQSVMRNALQDAIDEFKAIGGAGVVMDIQTGELLSLVSLPDFDPNNTSSLKDNTSFNRATKGVYEMGSIFKLFNTAMALDSGVVNLKDSFDATKPLKIGRFQIRDFHAKNRHLSVPEILVFSSNIGSAQIAVQAGTRLQRDYLGRFGLLNASSLEIPEVGAPLYPATWRKANTMTIAYGHGIAITPLQLTSAVGAVANGGLLHQPTLLKLENEEDRIEGQRVISKATSDQMRKLMRLVVLQGSGKKANSKFYRVGGKTGTADKQQNGTYNRRSRISSFAAVFPMENPKYAVLAMVDEPVGNKKTFGYATAGWVAAPVIKKVVDRIGPMLGLQPSNVDEEAYKPGDPLFIRVKG
ncbi:Peptidoglycan synthetase FtsI [Candidatus Terasakiella magnetica]|uniref:Peptidoglycan synthetase FtsI n=1 Tax=Candidatus Terasakiella magnetica TaxID=1867952 RepID=A0A1C3RJH2_9PROT|nr:penicillin-binding protein 2 [Candidatus Terasakiella magnetica]SCA57416.1 Peptidoglycan synthetase FtsI [Candidatus Terasakiella magnetica]